MASVFSTRNLLTNDGIKPLFHSKNLYQVYNQNDISISNETEYNNYILSQFNVVSVFDVLNYVYEDSSNKWQLKTEYTSNQRIFTIKASGNYATIEATRTSTALIFYFKLYYQNDVNILTLTKQLDDGAHWKHFVFYVAIRESDWLFTSGGYAVYGSTWVGSYNLNQNFIGSSVRNFFAGAEAPPDPYGTMPDNENPGAGYGPYDYTSETETPPQLPALSAAQVGFVSLWNPSQAEMQGLANYLWTGTFDLTNFKKLFTDPMECVLSVGIIPIAPTHEDTKREIVFGGSSHSGVNAYAVTEQFYIVDMGTLHITGMSQGALDYSPYAKASIYLPYCGTYALDVDEIMDSDISLEYHIDIYTGACVAYLTIDGRVNSDGNNVNAIMYQFTGNVLASIPITGNDHSQFIQSMLFMGAATAATVATSGAGAGATAGAGADLGAETAATGFNKALAGSAINTVMSMKPNVLHSGNLSTTAGMLGGQKPFITMTWSNLCRPEDEYKLVGLPLHKSGTLSDFSGFTIISACHMDNILCTDAELQMIEQALAKGVII